MGGGRGLSLIIGRGRFLPYFFIYMEGKKFRPKQKGGGWKSHSLMLSKEGEEKGGLTFPKKVESGGLEELLPKRVPRLILKEGKIASLRLKGGGGVRRRRHHNEGRKGKKFWGSVFQEEPRKSRPSFFLQKGGGSHSPTSISAKEEEEKSKERGRNFLNNFQRREEKVLPNYVRGGGRVQGGGNKKKYPQSSRK